MSALFMMVGNGGVCCRPGTFKVLIHCASDASFDWANMKDLSALYLFDSETLIIVLQL